MSVISQKVAYNLSLLDVEGHPSDKACNYLEIKTATIKGLLRAYWLSMAVVSLITKSVSKSVKVLFRTDDTAAGLNVR